MFAFFTIWVQNKADSNKTCVRFYMFTCISTTKKLRWENMMEMYWRFLFPQSNNFGHKKFDWICRYGIGIVLYEKCILSPYFAVFAFVNVDVVFLSNVLAQLVHNDWLDIIDSWLGVSVCWIFVRSFMSHVHERACVLCVKWTLYVRFNKKNEHHRPGVSYIRFSRNISN